MFHRAKITSRTVKFLVFVTGHKQELFTLLLSHLLVLSGRSYWARRYYNWPADMSLVHLSFSFILDGQVSRPFTTQRSICVSYCK